MVAKAFAEEQLPEDFADRIRGLLDDVAARRRQQDEAVRELSEMGADAVGPLCDALGDSRGAARQAAAEALCMIGDERALQPLLRLLYAGLEVVHFGVVWSGAFLNIPGAREGLLRMLDDGPVEYRNAVVWGLVHTCDDEEVVTRVHEVLRDVSLPHHVRNAALEGLCRVRPERTTELVREALADEAFRCQSGSAWWIALREGALLPAETCLLGFDRAVAPNSRLMAARLLLRHGDEGRALLEKLLRDGSPDQRATAALVLAHADEPAAFDVLTSEMVEGHTDRKWTLLVARTLVRQFGERLLQWARSLPAETRERPEVAWALARARLALALGTQEDIVLCGKPEQRKAAIRQLAREQRSACLPVLRRCLREAKPQKVAREAFRRLRAMRAEARPVVEEMLGSEHWGERKAAVGLLRQWGALTDTQRAAAAADPHIAVRHAAAGCRWPPAPH